MGVNDRDYMKRDGLPPSHIPKNTRRRYHKPDSLTRWQKLKFKLWCLFKRK